MDKLYMFSLLHQMKYNTPFSLPIMVFVYFSLIETCTDQWLDFFGC